MGSRMPGAKGLREEGKMYLPICYNIADSKRSLTRVLKEGTT
jgi:hypothetical protein